MAVDFQLFDRFRDFEPSPFPDGAAFAAIGLPSTSSPRPAGVSGRPGRLPARTGATTKVTARANTSRMRGLTKAALNPGSRRKAVPTREKIRKKYSILQAISGKISQSN